MQRIADVSRNGTVVQRSDSISIAWKCIHPSQLPTVSQHIALDSKVWLIAIYTEPVECTHALFRC